MRGARTRPALYQLPVHLMNIVSYSYVANHFRSHTTRAPSVRTASREHNLQNRQRLRPFRKCAHAEIHARRVEDEENDQHAPEDGEPEGRGDEVVQDQEVVDCWAGRGFGFWFSFVCHFGPMVGLWMLWGLRIRFGRFWRRGADCWCVRCLGVQLRARK